MERKRSRSSPRTRFGVLLTDQQAFRTSGLDLLEAARREHPDTIRVMVTPQTELDSAVEAIDRGQVHFYLCKPWDALELRLSLESALDRYKTARRLRELESRLLSTERVYTLGKVAAEIAHEIPQSPGGARLQPPVRREPPRGGATGARDPRRFGAPLHAHGLERILADCNEATSSILEITQSVESTTRNSSEFVSANLEEVVKTTLRALQRKGELVELSTERVPPSAVPAPNSGRW